jgi:hypothetical protein
MGIRDKLRRLEQAARGNLESFTLLDGSRVWYDPLEAYKEVFLHSFECLGADRPENRPEPPEILKKVSEARDVRAALRQVAGEVERDEAPNFLQLPYDLDVLLNGRRLVPLPHEPVPDLSE